MPTEPETTDPERFKPHAAREMASMFDNVSARYDLLNRVMTLGQDAAWRAAMWSAVPEDAARCLDLCTGSGISLAGLRRPGRLVLGMDVSLGMLLHAADRLDRSGWSPRLACADAFHLPVRDGSLDAITIAFGMRNLRPLLRALAEIRRALRAGGTLAVLEATAPAGGAFAPLHAFYLRHLIPFAGRISADPSAYRYLSESIFEFGSGPEFERDLKASGFDLIERRSFMLGATRLWVAHSRGGDVAPSTGAEAAKVPQPPVGGREPVALGAADGNALHNARPGESRRSEMPQRRASSNREWRTWTGAQLVTSAVLFAALAYGIAMFWKLGPELPLAPWQRRAMGWLLVLGTLSFGARTVLLCLRLMGPPPRR